MFDVNEAATRLGIAVITLRRMIYAGRISYRRIGPKLIRFTEADLREFLENATVPAGSAE